MTSLVTADFGRNRFSGKAPTTLPPRLGEVLLMNNLLSGAAPVPQDNSNSRARLVVYDAHNNTLSGQVPAVLAECDNLEMLHLNRNWFSYQVPKEFGHAKGYSIDFSENPLLCPLPQLPPSVKATCQLWHLESVTPNSACRDEEHSLHHHWEVLCPNQQRQVQLRRNGNASHSCWPRSHNLQFSSFEATWPGAPYTDIRRGCHC